LSAASAQHIHVHVHVRIFCTPRPLLTMPLVLPFVHTCMRILFQWVFPVGHFILTCEKYIMSKRWKVKTRAGKKGSSMKAPPTSQVQKPSTDSIIRESTENSLQDTGVCTVVYCVCVCVQVLGEAQCLCKVFYMKSLASMVVHVAYCIFTCMHMCSCVCGHNTWRFSCSPKLFSCHVSAQFQEIPVNREKGLYFTLKAKWQLTVA
jgi:hypothetical protein